MRMEDPATETAEPEGPPGVVARVVMLQPEGEPLPGEPGAAEIKLARKNSLGLEFALHYPDAQGLIAEETAREQAFRDVMAETSDLLSSRDLPHIYIKFRKLYHYYDSNVDVVVRQRDWERTIAALESAGYSGHVMFKEPDKIMFERPTARVSVHLHPGVTWNGVPYFGEEELWANALPSPDGRWLEMSDEYDFLINLGHNVFENYEVSLGDALYFRRFLRIHPVDTGRAERIAAANGWLAGYRHAYSQARALAGAWNEAAERGTLPAWLLKFPYRMSAPALARSFTERIAWNARGRRMGPALRETYAYPAFYALKMRHDLPLIGRS